MRSIFMIPFLAASLALGQDKPSDTRQGAQRFIEYCAGCHGADAKGGDKGPSLLDSSKQALSDAELVGMVRSGTPQGMPPFGQIGDANIRSIVRYLRRLQQQPVSRGAGPSFSGLPGDAIEGRLLFFGKAQCSQCHMIEGNGGFIGADLTNYGWNRAPDVVLHAITTPDKPLVRSSRVVSLTTRSSARITGVLRNEDNFMLELQTEDGRYRMLRRNEVSDIKYTDHSLMPRNYGVRLTSKELEDIVRFLMTSSRKESK